MTSTRSATRPDVALPTHAGDGGVAMSAALGAFGVAEATLSSEEKQRLDTDGVLVLEHHVDHELLNRVRVEYDSLTQYLNLVDKGDAFREVVTDAKLLAAALHVLARPFKLFAINARSAMPGGGLQPLHADWGGAVEPARYSIVNSIWMLDDFTEDNGSTRYVPGSHLSGRTPSDEMEDRTCRHPRERRLIAPAGSVAIMNGHVWHGGTLNASSQPRRMVACALAGREHPQQTDQRNALSEQFVCRLRPAERWLLDLESPSIDDTPDSPRTWPSYSPSRVKEPHERRA